MGTVFVAASNASKASKRSADVICSSGDDSARLSAVLAGLLGGVVVLSEGDFLLTEPLVYPEAQIALRGQALPGLDAEACATRLRFEFEDELGCVAFHPSRLPQGLSGVAIIGDGVNTCQGIYLANHCAFKQVRDVSIFDVSDIGVCGDAGNNQGTFENVIVCDSARGFLMWGHANQYVACRAVRLTLGGSAGFITRETGARYVGCVAERYAVGFSVGMYARGVTMCGIYAEVCGSSLIVSGGEHPPVGVIVNGLFSYRAQHPEQGAIQVKASEGVFLKGLCVLESVSGLSVEVSGAARALLVTEGVLNDATPYTVVSSALARIEDVSAQGQWLDWTST